MGDDNKHRKKVHFSEVLSKKDTTVRTRALVGNFRQTLRRTPKFKKISRYVIGSVVLIGLIVGVVAYIQSKSQVAFTIKDKTYSKALIGVLAKVQSTQNGYAQSPKMAAKDLFNYLKEQQAASDLGITPSKAQISQQVELLRLSLQEYALSVEQQTEIKKTQANSKFTQPKLPSDPTDSPYVNLWVSIVATHNALEAMYSNLETGEYQGYSFSFDFSDKIIQQRSDAPITGHGDAKLIAKDQAYAKERATYYHDQIAHGHLKAVDLYKSMKADYRLGTADKTISFSTLSSTHFDNTLDRELDSQVFYQQVVSYITKQTKTGLGPVGVIKVPNDRKANKSSDYADGVYYFVEIDSAKKAVPNAKQLMAEKFKTIKASYNGI